MADSSPAAGRKGVPGAVSDATEHLRMPRFFQYSSLDGLLVLKSLFQISVIIGSIVSFGIIPIWIHLLLGFFLVYAHVSNINVVAHNFLHNPFFVSPLLNRCFSLINSIALGMSQEAYRIIHFNHHAYNNDFPDEHGETKDRLSIYRYGKDGKPEPLWKYMLFAHFRLDLAQLIRRLRREGKLAVAFFETVFFVAIMTLLFRANPRGFVWFYLPVYALGWTFNFAESYAEHYGARIGDREGNSVSCYSWLYNFLWFNNGYHMEHHYRPKAHWTQLPELRRKYEALFREHGYKVITGSHFFGNLFGRNGTSS